MDGQCKPFRLYSHAGKVRVRYEASLAKPTQTHAFVLRVDLERAAPCAHPDDSECDGKGQREREGRPNLSPIGPALHIDPHPQRHAAKGAWQAQKPTAQQRAEDEHPGRGRNDLPGAPVDRGT